MDHARRADDLARGALPRSRMSAGDQDIFAAGPTANTVRTRDGRILAIPDGWVHLPPGDAALTRRVKSAGVHWLIQETRGRKVFSRGLYAPAAIIARIRAELDAERSTPAHAKRQTAAARR